MNNPTGINGGGHRPSIYKPEYDIMIIDHCAKGFSVESFAGLVGVDRDTIDNWIKLHPSFSEARKKASEASRMFWEKSAIDNLISKTVTVKKGNESKTESSQLNAAIWVFNMKNRFGWSDRKEITIEDKPKRLVINTDDPKKDE